MSLGAHPTVLKKAIGWLGQEDAPLFLRWRRYDPDLWRWLARFLLNCNYARAKANTDRIVRVALYSRSCLQALRREVSIDYDLVDKGILHFFRDPQEFDHACEGIEATQRLGLVRRRLTAAEVVALEPSLAAMGPSLLGGILYPRRRIGRRAEIHPGLGGSGRGQRRYLPSRLPDSPFGVGQGPHFPVSPPAKDACAPTPMCWPPAVGAHSWPAKSV